VKGWQPRLWWVAIICIALGASASPPLLHVIHLAATSPKDAAAISSISTVFCTIATIVNGALAVMMIRAMARPSESSDGVGNTSCPTCHPDAMIGTDSGGQTLVIHFSADEPRAAALMAEIARLADRQAARESLQDDRPNRRARRGGLGRALGHLRGEHPILGPPT
jgi:hypothetical protein